MRVEQYTISVGTYLLDPHLYSINAHMTDEAYSPPIFELRGVCGLRLHMLYVRLHFQAP